MSKLALWGGNPVRKTPYPSWPCISNNDIKFINRALHKNWWRGMGRQNNEIEEFENLFAKMHKLEYGMTIVNGTAALNTAIEAINFEKGSEIIVTPYSYAASAFCIVRSGLKPVFVDIDPNTYNIDPLSIEQAITEKTRGIVLVHLGGHPVDFDSIVPIASQHNLKIIEDCAHAIDSEWRGIPVGAWGDIACFSFHASKNLTCGEGGFIGTSSNELYEKCWMIHNMGRKIDGQWYDHKYLGENLRFNPINAALLLSQYKNFGELQKRRENNMNYFRSLLSNTPFLQPLYKDDRVTRQGLHLFICRYKSEYFFGIPRHRFLSALQSEGIPCHVGYRFPLYENRPLKNYKNFCPNAESACYNEAIWFDHNLFLGTKEDIDDIFHAIIKVQRYYTELIK